MQNPVKPSYQPPRGVFISRWIIMLLLAAVLMFMFVSYSSVNTQKAQLLREIDRQKLDLAAAQMRGEELEAELMQGVDEVQLRSVAINRMGMQVPTQEQVYRIPVPYVIRAEDAAQAPQKTEKASLFSVFLSLFQ